MTQNQNSEINYLFDSLALHRAKYLKLVREDSNDEELNYCEKAIQFYLSAISMVTGVHKPIKHFSFSFKSLLGRFTSSIKSKPTPYSLQTT